LESDPSQPTIAQAMQTAERLCAARNARLTPLRRAVLEFIWCNPKPISAYGLLEALQRWQGKPAGPPTVYRALEFLMAHGLVHRLASLNAFVGCPRPTQPHPGQFFICTRCGNAIETTEAAMVASIHQRATEIGFQIQQEVIEIKGLCSQCRELSTGDQAPSHPGMADPAW